jgi:hypothetical protein
MNTLPLPKSLLDDLQRGRPIGVKAKQRLAALLAFVESPWPDLYDVEGIKRESGLWTSEYGGDYLGSKSDQNPPGDIDPNRAIIIGRAEADSPIVLDYRVSPPRVVYFGIVGGKSLWLELAPSYEALLSKMSG